MFVTPPPTTSSHLPLGLLTKKKSNELSTIAEHPGGQVPLGSTSEHSAITRGIGREKDFVNAPPEFANRARDEIKKRLLQKRAGGAGSSSSSARSMHSYRSRSSSSFSQRDAASDNVSVLTGVTSASSAAQSSLFSMPSLNTMGSQVTNATSIGEVDDGKSLSLTLDQALPTIFYDMYSPDILMNPQNLMSNGRPQFTKRELLDWELNDVRSLLIIDSLRPEWMGKIPIIELYPLPGSNNGQEPKLTQFRFQLLPLNSSDDVIISTLVTSDLYLEANLDYEFKLTSAQYTVSSARRRHEELIGYHEPVMQLSKPEWRNIIENYLLNIAVEAQCRFDFKRSSSEYKKWKLAQLQQQAEASQQSSVKRPNMPPPSLIPKKAKKSLLRRTLLRNSQLKLEEQLELEQQQQQHVADAVAHKPVEVPNKVSLTKEEKSMIWSHCQLQVYQRLGLDWTPDNMSGNILGMNTSATTGAQ